MTILSTRGIRWLFVPLGRLFCALVIQCAPAKKYPYNLPQIDIPAGDLVEKVSGKAEILDLAL